MKSENRNSKSEEDLTQRRRAAEKSELLRASAPLREILSFGFWTAKRPFLHGRRAKPWALGRSRDRKENGCPLLPVAEASLRPVEEGESMLNDEC
jgi:hypothetical protein